MTRIAVVLFLFTLILAPWSYRIGSSVWTVVMPVYNPPYGKGIPHLELGTLIIEWIVFAAVYTGIFLLLRDRNGEQPPA